MARKTLMKTRPTDDGTEVLVLVNHPMETGLRIDPKTKKKIPAHFIQKMVFELNGKEVANADFGIGVSANPLTGILLKNAKAGDKVSVHWSDNEGETGSAETVVG